MAVTTAVSGTPRRRASRLGAAAAYAAMLVGAAGLFILIDRAGGELSAASPSSVVASTPSANKPDVLIHVLVTLAAVVVVGQLLGRLCRRFGQPPVIGEVLAGI